MIEISLIDYHQPRKYNKRFHFICTLTPPLQTNSTHAAAEDGEMELTPTYWSTLYIDGRERKRQATGRKSFEVNKHKTKWAVSIFKGTARNLFVQHKYISLFLQRLTEVCLFILEWSAQKVPPLAKGYDSPTTRPQVTAILQIPACFYNST